MRGANECAPKKCTCGRKLSKPVCGYIDEDKLMKGFGCSSPSNDHRRVLGTGGKVWNIPCICGIHMVWSWHGVSNGCWKERSIMPLMDSKRIVEVA